MEYSFELTMDEYNYLLPVIKKLNYHNGRFYIVCDTDYLKDALNRLMGLYEVYDEHVYNELSTIAYHCYIKRSLEPFRVFVGNY